MRTLPAIVLLFVLAAPSMAGATCYDWPLRTSQGRMAYDGDTIYITMPGLPSELSEMLVRVAGVDTPEIRGKCISERVSAIQARDFVVTALREARSVSFCKQLHIKIGSKQNLGSVRAPYF